MEKKSQNINLTPPMMLGILTAAFVVVNFLFLTLIRGEARTINLLKTQLTSLSQDQQIITSSNDLYNVYKDSIDIISEVFPSEETIPEFIQTLEELLKTYSDGYGIKFNSLSPLREQDNLYIVLTITMKTDFGRLTQFLEDLEHLRYMTHVASLTAKTPSGLAAAGEVTLALKVYVQNPFTTK